jgi:hypothetical protein
MSETESMAGADSYMKDQGQQYRCECPITVFNVKMTSVIEGKLLTVYTLYANVAY